MRLKTAHKNKRRILARARRKIAAQIGWREWLQELNLDADKLPDWYAGIWESVVAKRGRIVLSQLAPQNSLMERIYRRPSRIGLHTPIHGVLPTRGPRRPLFIVVDDVNDYPETIKR